MAANVNGQAKIMLMREAITYVTMSVDRNLFWLTMSLALLPAIPYTTTIAAARWAT